METIEPSIWQSDFQYIPGDPPWHKGKLCTEARGVCLCWLSHVRAESFYGILRRIQSSLSTTLAKRRCWSSGMAQSVLNFVSTVKYVQPVVAHCMALIGLINLTVEWAFQRCLSGQSTCICEFCMGTPIWKCGGCSGVHGNRTINSNSDQPGHRAMSSAF